jgi:hypothetical protein
MREVMKKSTTTNVTDNEQVPSIPAIDTNPSGIDVTASHAEVERLFNADALLPSEDGVESLTDDNEQNLSNPTTAADFDRMPHHCDIERMSPFERRVYKQRSELLICLKYVLYLSQRGCAGPALPGTNREPCPVHGIHNALIEGDGFIPHHHRFRIEYEDQNDKGSLEWYQPLEVVLSRIQKVVVCCSYCASRRAFRRGDDLDQET